VIEIENIIPGNAYACKFRVKTMLDEHGRPAPNLTDTPLNSVGVYEGFGLLKQRDTEQGLVIVVDNKSSKEFIVPFSDIWDVDAVEFTEE